MDHATICRCCLSQQCSNQLNFTFKNIDGDFENYSDVLLECFNIWVTEIPELPSHVCDSCVQRLQDALDFRRMVVKSDEEFLSMIKQGDVQCTVPSTETDHDDDDDDDDEMNMDDMETTHTAVKQNHDENDSNILLTTVKVKQEVLQGTTDYDYTTDYTQNYLVHEEPAYELESKRSIEVPVKFENSTTGSRVQAPLGPSLQFLFTSTSVKPFRWTHGVFQCFYCKASTTDYIRLRTHIDTHKCSAEEVLSAANAGLPIKLDITNITCNVCRESFTTLTDMFKHLDGKHRLGFDYDQVTLEEYKVVHLKCHLCVNTFEDFNSLQAHVLQKHKLHCPECDRQFYNREFLFNHLSHFHKVVLCQPTFRCKSCKIKFQTKELLDTHFASTHHTPSLAGYKVEQKNDEDCVQCPICRNKFSTQTNLQLHINRFHVQCKSCARVFDCPTTLARHLEEAHHSSESEDPESDEVEFADPVPEPQKSTRISRTVRHQIKANLTTLLNMSSVIPFSFRYTKFICFYCREHLPDPESLREHTTSNHPVCDAQTVGLTSLPSASFRLKLDVYNLRCKACDEQPSDLDQLLTHLTQKHNVSFDPDLRACLVPFRLTPNQMECVHCPGLIFQYFNLLCQHVNSMHGQENEICDHCGKCFDTKAQLKGHILKHHVEGKYVCKICNEDLVNWHRLRNHLSSVHGEVTEVCGTCGEKFLNLYLKQKHMMTVHNSGHKCPHCDRVFHLRSFMNNHIRRTHLKEKNVPCHVCGKRFFNKLTLSGHMATHDASLQKLHYCDYCVKGYTKKKDLRLHIARHHTQ